MRFGLTERQCGVLMAALRNWKDVSGDNIVDIIETVVDWGYLNELRDLKGKRARFKKAKRCEGYYDEFERLVGQEGIVTTGVIGEGVHGALVSVCFPYMRLALYADEIEEVID